MNYHNNMTVAELFQLRTQKETERYFISQNLIYWTDEQQVEARAKVKALTNEIRQIEQEIKLRKVFR